MVRTLPSRCVGQPLIDEHVVGLVIRVTLKVARLIHVEEKQRLWLSGGERQRLVVMKSHVALEPDDVHVEGDLAAVPGTLVQGKCACVRPKLEQWR